MLCGHHKLGSASQVDLVPIWLPSIQAHFLFRRIPALRKSWWEAENPPPTMGGKRGQPLPFLESTVPHLSLSLPPHTHTRARAHTHTHTLTHPSLGPWRPLAGPANVKAVVHRRRSCRDESLGQRRLRGAEETHPQGVGARVVESPVSRGPVSLSLWGELAGAGGCWVSTDFSHVLWGSH